MFKKLMNLLLPKAYQLKLSGQKFLQCVDSEVTEEFLEHLLQAMSLCCRCNPDYQKNIQGFSGRYLFKSSDNGIEVAVMIASGKMKVLEKKIESADIIVNFKNATVLRDFLFAPKQDILGAILKQEITLDGNINYLFKFAYMAKRLQLLLTLKV